MAGIYQIRNILTNHLYIGSTTVSFKRRKNGHFNTLSRNIHKNYKLQECYNNSKECLTFEILEECSLEILQEREQFFITSLNPYYNIIRNVAKINYGITRTDEYRNNNKERMSSYHNSETKTNLSNQNCKFLYEICHIPSSQTYFEQSLIRFSKEHSLICTHMTATGNNKRKSHKGYKVIEKIPLENVVEMFM